jgi:hypothetical protein
VILTMRIDDPVSSSRTLSGRTSPDIVWSTLAEYPSGVTQTATFLEKTEERGPQVGPNPPSFCFPPDLQAVIAGWSGLGEDVRALIVLMASEAIG